MSLLILMRHGKSMWNHLNLFTGWVDVPLNEQGIKEALHGGKLIQNIAIDVVFVSFLIRSQMTALLALSCHSSKKVPIMQHKGESELESWSCIHSQEAQTTTIPMYKAWQLNERMYGDLQGLNKEETAAKYGPEQVHLWRRSYDIAPPNGESLEMAAARAIPYFHDHITPHLASGRNVFIVAHGNSLRSIIMYLENLSREQIVQLELQTGQPLLYEYHLGAFHKKEILPSTM